jgi:hypothetical protein
MARCRHGDGGPHEQLSRSWSQVLTNDSRRGCTRKHSPAVPAGTRCRGVDTEVLPKKAAAKSATPALRHRVRGLTHGGLG